MTSLDGLRVARYVEIKTYSILLTPDFRFQVDYQLGKLLKSP